MTKQSLAILLSLLSILTIHPPGAIAAPAEPTVLSEVYAPLTDADLDALVAPIALYPDALVAQVLGAATYPDQVVEAYRYLESNRSLAGDALRIPVEGSQWDPAVQALTQFPTVLGQLARNITWTSALGDASATMTDPATAVSPARAGGLGAVWPYVQIARPDHWIKNAFMLLGVLLAVFYEPGVVQWGSLGPLVLAVVATCLVASSNYTLNEWLDGPTDALHPEKREAAGAFGADQGWLGLRRMAPAGARAGFFVAGKINAWFLASAVLLWVMGVVYNVPPMRTKEWAYVDVLSESVNNPIRLLLGWFALIDHRFPPVSLMLAYWMVGAYFMGLKNCGARRRGGKCAQCVMASLGSRPTSAHSRSSPIFEATSGVRIRLVPVGVAEPGKPFVSRLAFDFFTNLDGSGECRTGQ